jgi:hypothetical protein
MPVVETGFLSCVPAFSGVQGGGTPQSRELSMDTTCVREGCAPSVVKLWTGLECAVDVQIGAVIVRDVWFV